jgi:hypothetical protein
MTIGIPMFRDPGELRLDRLLTQPFRSDRTAAQDDAARLSTGGSVLDPERRSSVGSANPS